MDLKPNISLSKAQEIMNDVVIPVKPVVLSELIKEGQKENPGVSNIAKIISNDVALSAGIIKTVNSPFYGLPNKVMSIKHAVMMLGLENVINLSRAISLRNSLEVADKVFMETFWDLSTDTALISANIATEIQDIAEDEAYLLGLLCNCGVPLLINKFSSYIDIYNQAQNNINESIQATEEENFSISHCAVGYLIGKRWQFPELICQCILNHHNQKNVFSNENHNRQTTLLAIYKIAEHFSQKFNGINDYFEWTILRPDILNFLGIREDRFESLEKQCFKIFEESKSAQ